MDECCNVAAKSDNMMNGMNEWFDWAERKRKKGIYPRAGEHGAMKWTQLLDSKMFNHAEVPIFLFQFILLVM